MEDNGARKRQPRRSTTANIVLSSHSPNPSQPRRHSTFSSNLEASNIQRNRIEIQRQIVDKIGSVMKRATEPEKRFVCEADLRVIEADVRRLLVLEDSQQGRIEEICKRSLKSIAVLCWIGACESILRFHNIFFGLRPSTELKIYDDVLYELDENTVTFLGGSMKQRFLADRWIFKPVKIEEGRHDILWPASTARLPWIEESSDIGVGGFGLVKQVRIPPGYHITYSSGEETPNVNEGYKYIACKQIESTCAAEDFGREVRNLSILKDSLTSHRNIMIHIGFLFHDSQYFILLPLALGDLETFLSGERNTEVQELASGPEDPFMKMIQRASPSALMTQSYQLASALEWLHTKLDVPGEPQLSCIHMDLKPENILITKDDSSPVGIFKLSDFGISAINSSSESQSTTTASIGDAYGWLKSRTRPQRAPGTYQAPEVQKGASHVVGRKSDVWSFVCIFSEILTFALGGKELLSNFRECRVVDEYASGGSNNDFFYTIKKISGSGYRSYRPRSEVIGWLDYLQQNYGSCGAWVQKAADLIEDYLVADAKKRPGVERLTCDLRELTAYQTLPTERISAANSIGERPQPSKKDDNFNNFTDSDREGHFSRVSYKRAQSSSRGNDSSPISPSSSTNGSLVPELQADNGEDGASIISLPDPENYIDLSWKSLPSDYVLSRPKLSSFQSTPAPAIRRGGSYSLVLSPLGNRVAWIGESTVHIYDLVPHRGAVSKQVRSLPEDTNWNWFAICDQFLATAGNMIGSSRTLIHLYDKYDPSVFAFTADSMFTLKCISVSPQGKILLVSQNELKVLRKEPGSQNTLVVENMRNSRLSEQLGHIYECATFSSTGKHIFAWSWGSGGDRFHSWVFESLKRKWKYRYSLYYTKHYGSKSNKIVALPYDEIPGCIMQSKTYDFFSASTSEVTDGNTLSTRHETPISNVVLAKVFMDRWLITVERTSRNRWSNFELKRYLISGDTYSDGPRRIGNDGHVFGKLLSTSIKSTSKMEVLCQEQYVAVVVCNVDGSMEFARLV